MRVDPASLTPPSFTMTKVAQIAALFIAVVMAGVAMLACEPGAAPGQDATPAAQEPAATAGMPPATPVPTTAPALLVSTFAARPATTPGPSPTASGPTPPPSAEYHTPPPPPADTPPASIPTPPPPPLMSLPTATPIPTPTEPPAATDTPAPSEIPAPPAGTGVGETPPDFAMQLADGMAITSQDLSAAGRPVFMMYFATW